MHSASRLGAVLAIRRAMPRHNLIRTHEFPYHVSLRTNNREIFHVPLERVWEELAYRCYEASIIRGARIHALVLTPRQIRMVLTAPEHDMGIVMRELVRSGTKTLNRIAGRSGYVFGQPYHRTVITEPDYARAILSDIYHDPVKMNLCSRPEDYPFSTLAGIHGMHPLPVRTSDFPREGWQGLTSVLPTPLSTQQQAAIRMGLKRGIFRPPRGRTPKQRQAFQLSR